MKRLLGLWLLSVCTAVAALSGCAGKQAPQPPQPPAPVQAEIPALPEMLPEVLLHVPQRIEQAVPLSDAPLLGLAEQIVLHERALERFFAPWGLARTSIPATTRASRAFSTGTSRR